MSSPSDVAAPPLLAVDGLSIQFRSDDRWVSVVEDVSFRVGRGETVGLVGESGSGKTVTSLALMGLIASRGGRVEAGTARFDGLELLSLDERRWRDVRGRRIGMIFQQPTRALDPAFTVGDQIAEGVRGHFRVGRRDAWKRAVELLDRVGIADAARRARQYPHAFSGGMCQRVMIAMALACEPELLIADEPTTALDVTVQARILQLLADLRVEFGLSILFISHDLGVISQVCDRTEVMYAGQVVESAPTSRLLAAPRHPYSSALIEAIPRPGTGRRLAFIPGTVPAAEDFPTGCRFRTRCAFALAGSCDHPPLDLRAVPGDPHRRVRCARLEELSDLRLVEGTTR